MTATTTDPRRLTPPKGLVLKHGLFWAPPSPVPLRGQASHELLERQRQFDFIAEND